MKRYDSLMYELKGYLECLVYGNVFVSYDSMVGAIDVTISNCDYNWHMKCSDIHAERLENPKSLSRTIVEQYKKDLTRHFIKEV